MSISHTAEQMAIAVLRGDEATALQLADLLIDNHVHGEVRVPSIKDLSLGEGTLRVVLFTNPCLGGDVRVDMRALHDAYNSWLRGEGPLIISGMEADIYLLPNSLGLPDPQPAAVSAVGGWNNWGRPSAALPADGVSRQDYLSRMIEIGGDGASRASEVLRIDHPVDMGPINATTLRVMRLEAEPEASFLARSNGRPIIRDGQVIGRTVNARWESPYVVVDMELAEDSPDPRMLTLTPADGRSGP